MTKIILASVLVLSLASSCKKFIEVKPSSTTLNTEYVFEDYATATSALTNIYSKIREEGILHGSITGLPIHLGTYTDEMVSYRGNTSSLTIFYKNIVLSSTSIVSQTWNSSYNQIYAANAVIEGVQNSKMLSEPNKKQLQGEALFIRALIHFYLVNVFGEIPYITGTDYRLNSTVSRTSKQKIYENLELDLQTAISLLPDTYSPVQRTRPNRYAANALLARVYLYNSQYSEAAAQAFILLSQPGLFSLETNLDNVFLTSSKETIWQLQASASGQNTYEGASFIFLAGPPPNVSLTNNLVNSFSVTDLRRSKWIKGVTDGITTWYHAFKYKERDVTAASREYSVVLRLAEQYLIRAEARAQLGDLTGAKQDLDMVRTRAGLSATTAQTKSEILNAILQERRWELFTEFAHRFFDLKRFGVIDNVLSPLKPGWNTEDRLLPIPQRELNVNPNLLPQNPGY